MNSSKMEGAGHGVGVTDRQGQSSGIAVYLPISPSETGRAGCAPTPQTSVSFTILVNAITILVISP